MSIVVLLIALAIALLFLGAAVLPTVLLLLGIALQALALLLGSLLWLVMFCFRPRAMIESLREALARP